MGSAVSVAGSVGQTVALRSELRFRYFVEKVGRVQIWQHHEHVLFQRLKAIAQELLEQVAFLCNERYKQLCSEPKGHELVTFHWPPEGGAGDYNGNPPRDPYSPIAASAALDADGRAEDGRLPGPLVGPEGVVISGPFSHVGIRRQDHDSVRAIVVYDEAKREAGFEREHPPALARTGSRAQQMDEEIFISQLYRRAKLLNDSFQEKVADIIHRHTARPGTDSDNGDPDFEIPHCAAPGRSGSTAPPAAAHPAPSLPASPRPATVLQPPPGADEMAKDSLKGRGRGGGGGRGGPGGGRASDGDGPDWPGAAAAAAAAAAEAGATRALCRFAGGVTDWVEVHPAPVKTVERMREKLTDYCDSDWPLTANILDPVRLSVVCSGPAQILEVIGWFTEGQGVHGLPVCRVKNKFGFAAGDVVGGYRDVTLCVLHDAGSQLRIIAEIQIQDRALYELKLKMHKLYKVQRASTAATI